MLIRSYSLLLLRLADVLTQIFGRVNIFEELLSSSLNKSWYVSQKFKFSKLVASKIFTRC